ncbi:UDP-N-acetylglucosamine 2-epimerase [Acidaminococcus sp.]|uniref:UDP-N-acetylglucosamine 2-epimerase n=1 Tax=Acidaminococcus sp. TaxID=1872103 RepID=UPI003D7D90A4
MSKTKIAFVTGSRADYGIMRHYLGKLKEDASIDLELLVTGALLDSRFGKQVSLIENDGFPIGVEISLPINPSSNAGVLHTMAVALDKFGEYFQNHCYNLLLVLGDRYEILPVALAAAMQRIPILHIHGGEATFANYDEFIRHAITKMSWFHFTATEIYRKRVIQLGEAPERVFNLGALGAENCLEINDALVPETVKKMPSKQYFVVLFHPETLTERNPVEQVNQILLAVKKHPEFEYVFLGSNADTHGDEIRQAIKSFVSANDNAKYFENLPTDGYHALLKNSICLLGNSSSGIIEAPSLGIYTINVGDRQKGRVRGNSVIDVTCDTASILSAMDQLTIKPEVNPLENPYYQPNTVERYYRKTKDIIKLTQEGITKFPKAFFDINFKI